MAIVMAIVMAMLVQDPKLPVGLSPGPEGLKKRPRKPHLRRSSSPRGIRQNDLIFNNIWVPTVHRCASKGSLREEYSIHSVPTSKAMVMVMAKNDTRLICGSFGSW